MIQFDKHIFQMGWNHQLVNGSFNWMIPNRYIGNVFDRASILNWLLRVPDVQGNQVGQFDWRGFFSVKTYIGDIYYFTTGKDGCEDGANVGGLEG